MIEQNNDIYQEVFTILCFLDKDLINLIPENVIQKICALSANSNIHFYPNLNQKISEQPILEQSKDLLALLYYTYIANEDEKKELKELWFKNDLIYQEQLNKKYDPNKLFQKKGLVQQTSKLYSDTNTEISKYNKKSIFIKIKNFIKDIFFKKT